MQLAPIILFVYNRLSHTQKTVEALLKNPESKLSDLYIFSDAPQNESNNEDVKKIRDYIATINGFKSITIELTNKNRGLAASIIYGVTKVVNTHNSVIVLEDDMVTSPFFLKFMNEGLQRFQNDEQVASIHAYSYPTEEHLPDYFMLEASFWWGWATWKRAWDYFEPDGSILLKEIQKRNLEYHFDFKGRGRFISMLKDQIHGRNDSWALRWYGSTFLKNMLTLHSGRSFLQNIGLDGTGVHCGAVKYLDVKLINEYHGLPKTIRTNDDASARRIISNFLNMEGEINIKTGWPRFKHRVGLFIVDIKYKLGFRIKR